MVWLTDNNPFKEGGSPNLHIQAYVLRLKGDVYSSSGGLRALLNGGCFTWFGVHLDCFSCRFWRLHLRWGLQATSSINKHIVTPSRVHLEQCIIQKVVQPFYAMLHMQQIVIWKPQEAIYSLCFHFSKPTEVFCVYSAKKVPSTSMF